MARHKWNFSWNKNRNIIIIDADMCNNAKEISYDYIHKQLYWREDCRGGRKPQDITKMRWKPKLLCVWLKTSIMWLWHAYKQSNWQQKWLDYKILSLSLGRLLHMSFRSWLPFLLSFKARRSLHFYLLTTFFFSFNRQNFVKTFFFIFALVQSMKRSCKVRLICYFSLKFQFRYFTDSRSANRQIIVVWLIFPSILYLVQIQFLIFE